MRLRACLDDEAEAEYESIDSGGREPIFLFIFLQSVSVSEKET